MSTEEVTAESYTADFIMPKIKAVMQTVHECSGGLVKCVTMDSEGAHQKARRELAKELPQVTFLPCYAHQMNLILQQCF